METKPKRHRKRFSEQEQRQLMAAWRKSGLSAAAFSQEAGVNKSNLWRWSRASERGARSGGVVARAREVSPASRFIELRVDQEAQRPAAAARASGHTPLFEVDGPLGMRVRVYAGVDAETLSRLLAALPGGARC